MNRAALALGLAALAIAFGATPGIAGGSVAPAPLLGAGLPGIVVLAVAGGGYLAVRAFRRRRD